MLYVVSSAIHCVFSLLLVMLLTVQYMREESLMCIINEEAILLCVKFSVEIFFSFILNLKHKTKVFFFLKADEKKKKKPLLLLVDGRGVA